MPLHKHYTDNGVEITDGLRVWTNDAEWGTVDYAGTSLLDSEYFEGWFRVTLDSGRSATYNGERMTTAEPPR
jgi:hypothetical protein